MTWPPFTSNDWPVMTLERSEAKNSTASAISEECGILPSRLLKNYASLGTFEGSPKGEM